MINVSDELKAAMKEPIKAIRATMTVLAETEETTTTTTDDDGNETTETTTTTTAEEQVFTGDDELVSFSIESSGVLFGSALYVAEAKLIGTEYDFLERRVDLQVEVQIDEENDTWEAIDYGVFTVSEQASDLDTGMTTFKFIDKMTELSNTEYVATDHTYPCTIAEFIEQISDKFSLGVGTDLTTLPNYDYEIPEDLYSKISGATYRDIIAEIAGATGTMAIVHEDGYTLDFILPNREETDGEWEYDNLIKIKLEPKYGPINSVVLARTPEEDNITVTDDESIEENGLTEAKLANNEILDDDRESLAQPLLDSVDGFYYYPFEATTEGHGYYECGDRINVTDGTNSWEVVITYLKIEVAGGITETVKGVQPDETSTDYALAGGIIKTIYNTEIKVDKQNQEISSIVSQLDSLENTTEENYTSIVQTINNITTNIQNAGGSNLIKNSAGFFKDSDGAPVSWTTDGTYTIAASSEAAAHGSISGSVWNLPGGTISQTITVASNVDNSEDSTESTTDEAVTDETGEATDSNDETADETTEVTDDEEEETSESVYSFSCRVYKGSVGTGSIVLTDGVQDFEVDFTSGKAYTWEETSINNIAPKNNYLILTVTGSDDSDFAVTDMMLASGGTTSSWSQASGEFANTQVTIDTEGVKVTSSTQEDTYAEMNNLGFSGETEGTNYALNAEEVSSGTAKLTDGIEMPPIKIVPMDDGWAFVSMED